MNIFVEKSFRGPADGLTLHYCGKRIRNLSHSFGPYDRDPFLLYYIAEGSAIAHINGKKQEISAKGFFVNFPNSGNVYQSKTGVPWTIKWIVAEGEMLEKHLARIGITRETPYIPLQDGQQIEQLFDSMYEHFDKTALSDKFYCISLLYRLFSLLAPKVERTEVKNTYVEQAYLLIEKNYANPDFNVATLSQMLGLHFNYFSVLFKKETGITPIQAINNCRMVNAGKMLKFTDRPIKEIAADCGFSDEFYFSRVFKKHFSQSPKVYRKSEEYIT